MTVQLGHSETAAVSTAELGNGGMEEWGNGGRQQLSHTHTGNEIHCVAVPLVIYMYVHTQS